MPAHSTIKKRFKYFAQKFAKALTKKELIEFGDLLDGDGDYAFDDAINAEIAKVAPEVFASENPTELYR